MLKKIFWSRKDCLLYGLFFLSLLFLLMARLIPSIETRAIKEEMLRASQIMSGAMEKIRECREEKNLEIDPAADVNRTGMIGVRFSSITTTLGSLEAKRTSADPNFAGLLVLLLRRAGVHRNDSIAVSASGSFPGLILAALSAAKAMELEPLVMVSLGASQWGANRTDFHWLHMQDCLREKGIFSFEPVAISMGGDKDTGADMEEEGRTLLARDMAESGFPVISEKDLQKNVESKIRLFLQKASNKKIKAFVNIGGSWSNLGTDSDILHLKPGLGNISRLPPREKRGVLYAMADLGIPVIHMLFVRGLVQRYGLSWDPVPLPQPGQGEIYKKAEEDRNSFLLIAALYFLSIGLCLVIGAKAST